MSTDFCTHIVFDAYPQFQKSQKIRVKTKSIFVNKKLCVLFFSSVYEKQRYNVSLLWFFAMLAANAFAHFQFNHWPLLGVPESLAFTDGPTEGKSLLFQSREPSRKCQYQTKPTRKRYLNHLWLPCDNWNDYLCDIDTSYGTCSEMVVVANGLIILRNCTKMVVFSALEYLK